MILTKDLFILTLALTLYTSGIIAHYRLASVWAHLYNIYRVSYRIFCWGGGNFFGTTKLT